MFAGLIVHVCVISVSANIAGTPRKQQAMQPKNSFVAARI
jgi:hypothetical protein